MTSPSDLHRQRILASALARLRDARHTLLHSEAMAVIDEIERLRAAGAELAEASEAHVKTQRELIEAQDIEIAYLRAALNAIYNDIPARPDMTEAGRVAMMAEVARKALAGEQTALATESRAARTNQPVVDPRLTVDVALKEAERCRRYPDPVLNEAVIVVLANEVKRLSREVIAPAVANPLIGAAAQPTIRLLAPLWSGDPPGSMVSDCSETNVEPLYHQAAEFARAEVTMTISKMQARFRIGYNCAARLCEKLADDGVLKYDRDRGNWTNAHPAQSEKTDG